MNGIYSSLDSGRKVVSQVTPNHLRDVRYDEKMLIVALTTQAGQSLKCELFLTIKVVIPCYVLFPFHGNHKSET